jgi:hypothetical protein
LLIGSLLKSIISTVSSGKRVDELLVKKEGLVAKKNILENKLKTLDSLYYLEKVAREQLHLVKPGETVVMLPQNGRDERVESSGQVEEMKVWEEWVEVFARNVISN